MNEPLQLDAAELVDFLVRPGPAVLFLSALPAHPFNRHLCEHFQEEGGTQLRFGESSLLDLIASPQAAIAFLHHEIQACGASVPIAVPPGYYLFQAGRMIAWDAGLPSSSDVKRILRDSLPGAALSLLTRNLAHVRGALRFAAESAAAERLALHFRRAAADRREDPQRESADRRTPEDDLTHAYRVLGLDPTASDDEVQRAWRALQQRYHPDRAAQDPQEFERLSRLCVEINRARDAIRRDRRHRRRHAAAA